MRRAGGTLKLSLVIVGFLLAGCGGTEEPDTKAGGGSPDAALVGTYKCGPPQEPGVDTVELQEDGTLLITQPGQETGRGTWSASGDSGTFNPGGQDAETFKVEGDRLVFPDGFVCDPAS